MEIRLNRGLKIPFSTPSPNAPVEEVAVSSVALSGIDFPGLRADFLVETGQEVFTGQPLLRDRRRPEIFVTSPAAGVVTNLNRRDPETAAFSVRLAVQDRKTEAQDMSPVPNDDASVRTALLRSGLWAAFCERPFGLIPDPASSPSAILVTATRADALSPDPAAVIGGREPDFEVGIGILGRLTSGPVFICQHAGPPLGPNSVAFSGDYPSGLAGTHVHHLYPVDAARRVWTIGYQELLAMGALIRSGRLETRRTIALGGPAVEKPTLLNAPVGSRIEDLTRGRVLPGPLVQISGAALPGREAAYLGRTHLQVSVFPRAEGNRFRSPAQKSGTVHPIIPVAGHRQAFPFDLPTVPLLRALAVGDSETANALGCLDLLEEDMAVLSYVCPSGNDYGQLLRSVLTDLQREL